MTDIPEGGDRKSRLPLIDVNKYLQGILTFKTNLVNRNLSGEW